MKPALLLAAALLAGAAGHSGYDDASPAVQAMQDDDSSNPGMLWVAQGQTLWAQDGPNGKSCAACHGAPETMRGVAARYPRVADGVITLADQIQHCRTTRQNATPWPGESDEMLSMTALIGLQSRGLPVAVDANGPAQATLEQGRALFEQRMGQLNLSCANCHDTLAGHRLGGSRIPQGQPNGYPEYGSNGNDRLARAAAAQLHDRRPRDPLSAGFAGDGRTRIVSRLACQRPAGGNPGGPSLS